MENEKILPRMGTIQQAAEESGLSYSCVRNLCIDGKIVYFRSGAKYLINMDRLAEFLNGKNEQLNEAEKHV